MKINKGHKIINIAFVFLLSAVFIVCGNKSEDAAKDQSSDSSKIISEITKTSEATDTLFNKDSAITALKEVLSDEFCYVKSGYFLAVSNLSETETRKIADNSIKNSVDCFFNDYFEKTPTELITVFMFGNDSSYRNWAYRLYGDTDLSPYGYFKTSKKVMLMNIRTGTGTLIHEITHALVRYDFPDIPSWFNEGLGSLYERCSIDKKEIKGHVNWRLPTLQKSIMKNSYSPLAMMMKTNDDEFYGEESGYNYSQARYFCMYLQEKGLLKKYYKTFRDRFDEDKTGIKFAEEILNEKINRIDTDYKQWVMTLEYNER